jgi:asparagine N-glycosylation enzyme membrane subunit Stt3
VNKIHSLVLLAAAFAGALVLIVLHAWGIEETWIKPSLAPREQGAAGRTQWGGMIPEFKNPPRIFLDNDPYYWLRYAQSVARGETLRVRHTDLDNVPHGREVHWSSGWVWWLVAGGAVTSLLTGETHAQAIETWGLYATPVLLLLVFAFLAWWITRRLGAAYAAALIFLLACLPAVMWDYGYARPDHHGLHNTAALLLLLGFVMAGGGWVAASRRQSVARAAASPARRAMTVAAIGAATGLWIGATQQIFVLAGVGAGLLAGMFLRSPRDEEIPDPALFRWWGTAAALGALALYLLEYAPSHFGMRLEVNHPLYAAALWGAGQVLAAAAAWRRDGKFPVADRGRLGLAALVLALPLLALIAGPDSWHAWRDGAMRRQHDFINEFEPFINSLRHGGPVTLLARFGLLPLLLPLAAMLVFSGRLPASTRAGLLITGGAALVTGLMLIVQVRWSGLLSISLAALALAVLSAASAWLDGHRWRRWILGAGYAAAVAPLLVFFAIGVSDNLKRRQAGVLDGTLAWTIASRDLAFNLKRLAQMGPVRVMSGPGQTPALHFFGDVRGTAALYWENTDGVREAAVFFADQGDEDARRIARERGITHVVLQQDTSLAESSVRIALDSNDPELIKNSLAYRLCDPLGQIPPWLEPVPYYGSPMAAGFQMRVLRVRPDKLNSGQ